MKNKATHNGTCQCCGNSQAVNPNLSNHGYTVDFGYFHGTCRGANAQPLEESRDLSDQLVLELRAEATRLAALSTEDIKTITIKVNNNRFRNAIEATETVSSQEDIDLLCETHEHAKLFKLKYGEGSYSAKWGGNNFADKVKAQLDQLHRQAKFMNAHALGMEQRANLITGKKALDLREVVKDKVRFTIPNRNRNKEGAKAGWAKVAEMKESGEYLRVTTRRDGYTGTHNVTATPK